MAGSEYGKNYRGREPVQYSVGMVEHLDSREILEVYRDPYVQPAADVGYQGGRRDIWNRSWEKLALEGRPGHLEHGPSSINEGRLYTGQYGESHPRAMNFALDLSMKASVEAQKDFLEIQQALHPERALARWEDLKRRAPDAFGKDWDPAEMAARKESERPQFSMSEIIDTMGEDFARRTQEGAQGGWRLDRAAQDAGGPAGAQHIGVVNAVAPSQRGGHQRHHLVAVFARPGALPRSRRCWTSSSRPRRRARVAGRISPALATRRRSSKVIWIRSGWLRGSIYWVLLVLGSVCGYKTIIPEAQKYLLAASGR